MLNGYYCGHFGEDMTVAELAAGIRWHYENGYNLLDASTAFPPELMERPADLSADLPWYGKATSAEPDPYVYDGYMSPEDFELMHKNMEADRQLENSPPEVPTTELTLYTGNSQRTSGGNNTAPATGRPVCCRSGKEGMGRPRGNGKKNGGNRGQTGGQICGRYALHG